MSAGACLPARLPRGDTATGKPTFGGQQAATERNIPLRDAFSSLQTRLTFGGGEGALSLPRLRGPRSSMDLGSSRIWSPPAQCSPTSASPSLSPHGREGLISVSQCFESDGEKCCHMTKRNQASGTQLNTELAGRCFPATLSPIPVCTHIGPTALLTITAHRGQWSGGGQHCPVCPSGSSVSQPSQSSWHRRPRWWRSPCRSASCCPRHSGWDKPGEGELKTPAGPGGRSVACNPH